MTRAPLYDGAIQAHVVGGFVRLGTDFTVICPGYDAQGRRRQHWTQVVVDDVPVWEWKLQAPLHAVVKHFEQHFQTHVGGDAELLAEAIRMTQKIRRERFRDGVTGETPAPSLTRDGRGEGKVYPT